MTDEELGALVGSRRDFLKKMVAVGFAVPIISSFALDGVASAEPVHHMANGHHHHAGPPPNTQYTQFGDPNPYGPGYSEPPDGSGIF
jgi:hypothetical protein